MSDKTNESNTFRWAVTTVIALLAAGSGIVALLDYFFGSREDGIPSVDPPLISRDRGQDPNHTRELEERLMHVREQQAVIRQNMEELQQHFGRDPHAPDAFEEARFRWEELEDEKRAIEDQLERATR